MAKKKEQEVNLEEKLAVALNRIKDLEDAVRNHNQTNMARKILVDGEEI